MAIYTTDQYYEGILQLRPYNKKIYDFVMEKIDQHPTVFVTKEEKKKFGIDIYLTSARFAEDISKILKKKFGGTLIKSNKLFGFSKRKGKVVYRLTICHRLDKKASCS